MLKILEEYNLMRYNLEPPIATLRNISKNFQATTTIQTTYSKYSHVAT